MTSPARGQQFSTWSEFLGQASTWGTATWMWSDTGGLHLSNGLPATQPFATHLWGWGQDCWIRVRVDAAQILTAVLGRSDRVQVLHAQAWPPGEQRVEMVGPQGEQLRGASMRLVTHPDAPGLTFVEVVS